MRIFDRDYWHNYAFNLLLRACGVGFRFLVPFTLLASGASEDLGLYYLATSIIGIVSIFGGMELGLFYSIEYKKNENLRDRTSLQQFFYVLCGFNILLVLISIVFWIFWYKHLPELFVLIIIALAVESVSYELGRLLWNLGEVEKVSKRDFLRPLLFAGSILISLFLFNKILTSVSLLIFIISNTSILIYESRKYLGITTSMHDISWVNNVVKYQFLSKLFKQVGPQFLQNQILAASVILERLLFTATVGLAFLGSYAFIFTIISVLSHLIFMPKMVKVREIIIADQSSLSNIEAYTESIKFLGPVILVTLVITGVMAFAGPLIENYFDKDLNFSPMILITMGATSAIYAYNAAVSPLFSHKTRWLKANILTVFGLMPIVACIYFNEFLSDDPEMLALGAILISALTQLSFRLVFFKSRVNALSDRIS
tara:strand:+ start:537 stop:1820 length:1284 start_codon:yes stop_codon:yes gene_type:complete